MTEKKATKRQGFAAIDPVLHKKLSSKGGKSSSGSFKHDSERAREAGRKGLLKRWGNKYDRSTDK